ncbi:MAG: hypothetical protein ABGY96_03705 [bacterium]|nr:hypothetical protein [Gammaproteobacteria bacterium]HIL94522.1 hypothetical protein [Pseudomonadales bacterium]
MKKSRSPILSIAVALLASLLAQGLSAEDPLGMLDAQGHPLADPEYDEIRNWYDQEALGLNLYKNDEYERAYQTLTEPARHGYKLSQHALALMHLKGESTQPNLLIGTALLGLAAESGDRKLEKEYEKLLKKVPDKYNQLVQDQTSYYIELYGMKVQGIACSNTKLPNSNIKIMKCIKQKGDYPDYPWKP